ncbi:YgcG family protein [Pseudomonas sp. MAP12]|uniref:YgcG family protein n=1 Tax=Geopseudomonas aromaticivorans TaxID=2849492 RepID=A0ABS6MS34_9GAMM|nr:YgcG family protein [Pseudomonas aromaticivorans]MBV2131616.1 YgcG family protein [Pseudomonas aromaticivorans]
MSRVAAARAGLLALLLVCLAATAEPVAVPPLTARVIDQTATLTAGQVAALEGKLQRFEADKGSQLAVLIVPTTGDEPIEQYALRVVEQWKLGRKNVDDGALLIVAKDDRTLRIEVGYGLEGALNDATAKRIISEIIVPRFRQGDFHAGIDAGIDRMIAVIGGEPLPAPERAAGDVAGEFSQLMPLVVMLVLMLGGILRSLLGRLPAALLAAAGVTLVSWLLIGVFWAALGAGVVAFVFTLFGGGIGRGGGWHSGGRSGGGFGGGFGGGGGGFGGGGASGRW